MKNIKKLKSTKITKKYQKITKVKIFDQNTKIWLNKKKSYVCLIVISFTTNLYLYLDQYFKTLIY